jgi:hypothetical protein
MKPTNRISDWQLPIADLLISTNEQGLTKIGNRKSEIGNRASLLLLLVCLQRQRHQKL